MASVKEYVRYIDALEREMSRRANFFLHDKQKSRHSPRTIYIGGGTPSLLDTECLERLLAALRQHFDLSQLEEATIECNPEDLSPAYLRKLHDLRFFDRLSIGVQSFNDARLRRLNRRHSAAQSVNAIMDAAEAGFERLSIDLIYGQPGQSNDEWDNDLMAVEQLNRRLPHPIGHISCYALTVEPGTILEKQIAMGREPHCNDNEAVAHYERMLSWMAVNGYQQYEVSNFAQPVQISRHNSRYWDQTPYLGLGAAAHSFDGTTRRWNIADVNSYIDSSMRGDSAHESEHLTEEDTFNEYVMTSLRTTAGIKKSMIPTSFVEHLQKNIARFVKSRLIEETDTHYRPTPTGLLRADGIASDLFITHAR